VLRKAELEAWSGAECRALFGVAGFAPKVTFAPKVEKRLCTFNHGSALLFGEN